MRRPKERVNVYDLSAVARYRRQHPPKKQEVSRSPNPYCCGGKNTTVNRGR